MLIFLVNLIPFYALPYPDQLAYFNGTTLNQGLKGYLFLSLEQQYYFIALYNTSFVFYGAWFVYSLKAKGSIYIKKKVNILITRIFIVTLLTIIPGLFVLFLLALKSDLAGMIDFLNPDAVNNNYLYFLSLVLPLSFFFVPNWLYNEKEPFSFLDNFRTAWKKVVQSNSALAKERTFEKSSDLARIVAYIETEKPYVKVSFSLHDLSHALNIPRIRVTNCFNKDLNTSFPAYRNKLRVAHAISLLRAGAHLTISIEGIAERSGFKSKSIFYSAFKEEYNMTPTEWMKRNL
jgi:AraC-like DNA-binding protein